MGEEGASSSGFSTSYDKDSGFDVTSHEAMYKNKGMTSDAMRKRREETCAEIRKAKRYDDLNKRRQIDMAQTNEEPRREPEINVQSCSTLSQAITMTGHEQIACTAVDERIVAKLCGECPEDIEEALDFYRRRFRASNAGDVADEIVALNLIPRIVVLLQTGSTLNIRRTATHVVGAIVSICSTHTEAIVKSGVVPYLVDLITNPDREMRELTLFALGNIAAECCEYRDLCISYGMAEKMATIPDGSMTLMEARCAVWAASNLCRGKDPPVDLQKIAVLLPLFNEALYSSDTLIISDACRAFGRLLDAAPESSYKYILKPSAIECLVEHMGNPNSKISLAALLAVGNIVSGDDEQTQSVLNCGNALNYIHRLLLDGNQKTKREVCWVLSNIAAGTSSQIQTIFDAGIIPCLIQILKTETFQVRSEACWVIANAIAGGNREHIAEIVRQGALAPLCDMLTVMDCSVVVVVLKALGEILDCGDYCKIDGQNLYATRLEELNVVDKLEFLMLSSNTEIFYKACAIMEKYYLHESCGEDEAANNGTGVHNHKLNYFDFS
ncbi:hypothetical protein LOAG_07693 [Loa loa]|uniref:Importin subunit alpha n=1 Tax=Loa loa TaxID=7209 RepID=A0A1I7VHU2_LOALO|nr:hypothetical protein LOAG_07693 [Loa loa]EFO20800.2 hypothetical protein LOAG_07693 [Loa loa]